MMPAIASGVATMLTALALLHVYWALGGRRGLRAALLERGDGARASSRLPAASAGAAGVLLLAATLVLARAGLLGLPLDAGTARVGCWGVASAFAIRAIGDFRLFGVFRTVRTTRFARLDRTLYTPLCAVVAVLAGAVADS